MYTFLGSDILIVASRLDDVKGASLVLGLGALIGGVLLLFNHKRHLDNVLASQEPNRVKAFEARKYRRRASASTMIACMGTLLGGIYWITDEKVFAVFILMILALLLGIFGLAVLDLFSVGIHLIATPDPKAQRKMIEDYLREREKLIANTDNNDSETNADQSG